MDYEILYVAIWYMLIVFLGIATLPVTASVFRNLPDRGYSVSKILGILLIAYISWILSYLIGYSRYEIILSLFLICILSVYVYIKFKPIIDKRLLFRNELMFGSVFLFFLIIRAFNPDIHGGEKVSDFMLLNSIIKSSGFPPHDSWLSGYTVNMYYYFGTYTIATLTKLTAIPGHISYNLGMSLIPALAANAAFGIGYNLTRSKKAGFVAMFLLVFAGNLYPAGVITAHILGITTSQWGNVPEIMDYWGASRIIPHTINEFPYFSFIFGDLHAHVIAIPFVLLTIMLILNFYFAKNISTFIFLCLGTGSLFVFNAWDYPAYAALFVFLLMIEPLSGRIRTALLRRSGTGISVLFLGALMFITFFIDFKPAGIQGIKLVEERTELLNFLVIYDLFLFLIFSFMLINLPEFKYKKTMLAVVALSGIALYFFPNFQTLSVFVPLGFLSGINIYSFYKNNDMNRLFVSVLIVTGLGILVFCELFYFDDLLGGSWERMNTVFKYYIQVWLLWSTASAYAFFDLYKKKYSLKNIVLVVFSLLIVLNSLYLITGTYAKTEGFSRSPCLDGIAFMKKINYGYYDAIFWINMNIKGTPVILEAPGSSYQDTSLISSYTGLPTVMGWVTHELVWRSNWGELSQRIRDVDTIYDAADHHDAVVLLKKYNVSYVCIGDVELKKYKAAGLRKFENSSSFEPAYRGVAEIYRVIS